MQFPTNKMQIEKASESGGYLDVELTDAGANGVRRLWVYTRDLESGGHYAMLRRSGTDDGAFKHTEFVLPNAVADALDRLVQARWH
jgi:hypothetical protein